ncbi:Uncharacterised protein [Sphingobacterium daejeonense]|nr:Uncharacterised protein [Sphingobacterium daejeonense]
MEKKLDWNGGQEEPNTLPGEMGGSTNTDL